MIKKKAAIMVNGEFEPTERLQGMLQQADLLVAVDGGLNHLVYLDLLPHLIIGDFDSIRPELLADYIKKEVEIKKFNPHKNETDLELALNHVLDLDFEQIEVFGATGGRFDHILGNIFLFSDPRYVEKEIKIWSKSSVTFYCQTNQEIKGQKGDLISLIPITAEVTGITTEGLLYPLNDETLVRWRTRGISNVMESTDARIQFQKGSLLCVHTFRMEVD